MKCQSKKKPRIFFKDGKWWAYYGFLCCSGNSMAELRKMWPMLGLGWGYNPYV